MTVLELLSRVDSYELTEWQAFFAIERERNQTPDKSNAGIADKIKSVFRKLG